MTSVSARRQSRTEGTTGRRGRGPRRTTRSSWNELSCRVEPAELYLPSEAGGAGRDFLISVITPPRSRPSSRAVTRGRSWFRSSPGAVVTEATSSAAGGPQADPHVRDAVRRRREGLTRARRPDDHDGTGRGSPPRLLGRGPNARRRESRDRPAASGWEWSGRPAMTMPSRRPRRRFRLGRRPPPRSWSGLVLPKNPCHRLAPNQVPCCPR
jgi:hypothetical protein